MCVPFVPRGRRMAADGTGTGLLVRVLVRGAGSARSAPATGSAARSATAHARSAAVGAPLAAPAEQRRGRPSAAVSRSRKIARITTERPASKPRRHVDAVEALHDLATEATGADHAGDDDHREREHDHLVDAGHDGRASRAEAGSGAGCATGRRRRRAPASTTSLSTPRMPSSVIRTPGAIAKMIVATMPGTTPTRNRISAGNQVDERRHGLHEVEHGLDDRRTPRSSVAARMPSGTLKTIAMIAGHQHERERVHGVAPLVDAARSARARRRCRPRTASRAARAPSSGDHDDDRPERRGGRARGRRRS